MRKRKVRLGDPTKAIGYLRVSTEDQNLGPEAQRSALERWAAANGAELVAVFEDHGVSGGAPFDKRPGLVAALDSLATKGAGLLLVAKRDRLARDAVAAATIDMLAERNGAKVRTADGVGNGDTPEDKLLRSLLDAFAEYERQVIRARTRAVLALKKQRGERIGDVPFGFRLGEDRIHLEPEPEEQKTLRRIHRLRQRGYTLKKLADRLNREGVPARGARWHLTTVHRVLARQTA